MQNDAQEFIAKLSSVFKLDAVKSHTTKLVESLENKEDSRIKDTNPYSNMQDITVTDGALTWQQAIDNHFLPESVEVRWNEYDKDNVEVSKKKFLSADIDNLSRLNFHVAAMSYDTGEAEKIVMKNADFSADIQVPIEDEKTKQKWLVTFTPKDIVVQYGRANGGHYYMYSKGENEKWTKHDDASVTTSIDFPKNEQAKIISYVIAKKEVIKK